MDREAWHAAVHGVTKSRTWMSDWTEHVRLPYVKFIKWVHSFCEKCLFNAHKLCVKWSESHSVGPNFLQPHGLNSPWNFPGQNTGVGSLSLLQGIFPAQGSNPGLLHCKLCICVWYIFTCIITCFVYHISHILTYTKKAFFTQWTDSKVSILYYAEFCAPTISIIIQSQCIH